MQAETKAKPTSITVIGRRWFERTNGNTYHSAEIYVDGKRVNKIPFCYGYGSQYEWSALEWLDANGYLPGIEKRDQSPTESLCRYCERHGIALVNSVTDVQRRKDL